MATGDIECVVGRRLGSPVSGGGSAHRRPFPLRIASIRPGDGRPATSWNSKLACQEETDEVRPDPGRNHSVARRPLHGSQLQDIQPHGFLTAKRPVACWDWRAARALLPGDPRWPSAGRPVYAGGSNDWSTTAFRQTASFAAPAITARSLQGFSLLTPEDTDSSDKLSNLEPGNAPGRRTPRQDALRGLLSEGPGFAPTDSAEAVWTRAIPSRQVRLRFTTRMRGRCEHSKQAVSTAGRALCRSILSRIGE